MFLITPKSKHNPAQTSQPVAKIRGPARVRAACDRCRVKKVKCDGDTPCLRCMQDAVICTASRKVPVDAKAASFEYIRSMETQQSRLIKALKDISRHVQQPVGREGIKEILETVRDCGFDFEGVVYQSDIEKRAIALSGAEKPTENQFGQAEDRNRPRKRKRESDIPAEAEINGTMVQHNGTPDSTLLDSADSFCQCNPLKHRRVWEPFDDYWDLDAYWDAVAGPFSPLAPTTDTAISFENQQPHIPPTMETATSFLKEQNNIPPSQDPSNLLESVPGSILQHAYNTQLNEQAMNDLSAEALGPLMDDELALPSLNTFNPLDWDSTLWWDPSSLFDPCLDSTQYHSNIT